MRGLAIGLVLVSCLAVLVGAASLSNATAGVGGIAIGCFLVIVARICQASAYHDDIEKWTAARAVTPAPATTSGAPEPVAVVRADRAPAALLQPNQIQCEKCGLIADRGPAACPQCLSAYE